MKKNIVKLFALILALSLCFTFTGCEFLKNILNPEPPVEEDLPDELAGITEDTIWVGNTAGTTGLLASIGAPFNLGIEAAFAAYNKDGGYNGKQIKLKHYDDQGLAENSVTYLDKLIHEDEVFAIVGHFGSYAVDATLDTLKDEEVPMIYAAAGNNALLNENAESLGDKGIVPIQPLNQTEGRMLILRAFAPADKGGLGATKVGVISNSNEASKSLLAGIKAEAENLPAAKKNNIVYQEVASADYSGAVNALKAAGCDTVILTVIGADFTSCLTTMANATYYSKVLTSYNNASATVFNDALTVMKKEYEAVFSTMQLYTQAWLDISSTTYVYNNVEHPLGLAYKALYESMGLPFAGQAGFNEAYWEVAEDIYEYALTVNPATAFAMSADSYALAGYIAGNLFCQAMEELEASGKALSRKNLISVLESKESYQVAMADTLSFANGMRAGVQSFALTQFYDGIVTNGKYHTAQSATVYGLMSLDDYRALLAE